MSMPTVSVRRGQKPFFFTTFPPMHFALYHSFSIVPCCVSGEVDDRARSTPQLEGGGGGKVGGE